MDRLALIKPFVGQFRLTSDFREHLARHRAPGLDFALPEGTPVLAASGGVVLACEWDPTGGRTVVVDHGDGLHTLYGHLRAVWRVRSERVNAGEFLGLSGNTGTTTAPHLHFGVWNEGEWVDPIEWLVGWDGQGLL